MDLPSVSGAILKNGAYDVVTFAMEEWLRQTREDLLDESSEFNTLGTTNKVKLGVKTRLKLIHPYINVWPQAMALGLKPQFLS